MVLNFNLSPGDKITISWGKSKKKRYQPVTVVAEHPHHILVKLKNYSTSINKVDFLTGLLRWSKGWKSGEKGAIKDGFNFHLYPDTKKPKTPQVQE